MLKHVLLSFCGQNAPQSGAVYVHVHSSVFNAANFASLHVIRTFTAKRWSLRHCKVMKLLRAMCFFKPFSVSRYVIGLDNMLNVKHQRQDSTVPVGQDFHFQKKVDRLCFINIYTFHNPKQ